MPACWRAIGGPEPISVVVARISLTSTGYLCWMGSRAYMGRSPPPHGVAALALVVLSAVAVYFMVERPNPGARFVLLGLMAGVCFILTARTLAHGGFRRVPARYLFAATVGAHGVFVLVRPLAFGPSCLSSQWKGLCWPRCRTSWCWNQRRRWYLSALAR